MSGTEREGSTQRTVTCRLVRRRPDVSCGASSSVSTVSHLTATSCGATLITSTPTGGSSTSSLVTRVVSVGPGSASHLLTRRPTGVRSTVSPRPLAPRPSRTCPSSLPPTTCSSLGDCGAVTTTATASACPPTPIGPGTSSPTTPRSSLRVSTGGGSPGARFRRRPATAPPISILPTSGRRRRRTRRCDRGRDTTAAFSAAPSIGRANSPTTAPGPTTRKTSPRTCTPTTMRARTTTTSTCSTVVGLPHSVQRPSHGRGHPPFPHVSGVSHGYDHCFLCASVSISGQFPSSEARVVPATSWGMGPKGVPR